MRKKSAFTFVELPVVAGIFFIILAALTPFMRMVRKDALRVKCAKNIMKISLGLHSYAADHDELFPKDLGGLYPKYIDNQSAFDCPASKAVGTPDKPDYEYRAGLTEVSGAKEVIVQDAEGNHKKFGKNVLRVDGTIEWVKAAR